MQSHKTKTVLHHTPVDAYVLNTHMLHNHYRISTSIPPEIREQCRTARSIDHLAVRLHAAKRLQEKKDIEGRATTVAVADVEDIAELPPAFDEATTKAGKGRGKGKAKAKDAEIVQSKRGQKSKTGAGKHRQAVGQPESSSLFASSSGQTQASDMLVQSTATELQFQVPAYSHHSELPGSSSTHASTQVGYSAQRIGDIPTHFLNSFHVNYS